MKKTIYPKREGVPKTVKKEVVSKEHKEAVTSLESDTRITSGSEEHFTNEENDLKYGAQNVVQIFIPVILCLILVVVCVNSMPHYWEDAKEGSILPFGEDEESSTGGALAGLGNAAIIIGFIILSTSVIVFCFVKRFYKTIYAFLVISNAMILFVFNIILMYQVLETLEISVDYITAFFIAWNNGCTGILVIYWNGPNRAQQFYLILISAQVALNFIQFLPPWTTWMLLALLVVWDLVAVLCPGGPLRILVETVKSRNESFPAGMIYSALLHFEFFFLGAQKEESSTSVGKKQSTPKSVVDVHKHESQDHSVTGKTSEVTVEHGGVKLGLGDFIFYSILVGRVSLEGDWNTTMICLVAVLVGLCLTLMLLAIFKKALPALPISLVFALLFLFCTKVFVQPFADALSSDQLFI